MEAPYPKQPHPPPSQPPYSMPSGVPTMSSNDTNYRRDPPGPGPPYHAPTASQHQQNGQPYGYNPNSHPSLPLPPNRTPLPDQLLVSENAPSATLPPPLGSQMVEQTQEPPSHSMIELGRRYTLDVVQQPKRARMCGFGDKDRRPITPPPCIRLVITDAVTGMEIDPNDIDFSMFVLNVDLWSQDGMKEVNLVRHSNTSPAISSTLPTSYGQSQVPSTPIYSSALPNITRDAQYPYQLNQPPSNPQSQAPYNPYPHPPHANPYSQPNHPQGQQPGHSQSHYGQQSPYPPSGPSYSNRPPSPVYPPSRFAEPQNHHGYYGGSIHGMTGEQNRPGEAQVYNPADPNMNRMTVTAPIPAATGMFTRNLIGSLSASAFRLTDPNDKIGIWFILQDLSVRTEGQFRLRFSFVNVGNPKANGNSGPGISSISSNSTPSTINTGKAPILASCYSDVFTVYSAKKFPGVVESTPLSKCFANQGIKIPIRKEGQSSKARDGGEYDDD